MLDISYHTNSIGTNASHMAFEIHFDLKKYIQSTLSRDLPCWTPVLVYSCDALPFMIMYIPLLDEIL